MSYSASVTDASTPGGSYFRPISCCVPVVGLNGVPPKSMPEVGWNDLVKL